jgi:hypothetical protein
LARLIATLGTQAGSVYETLLNLCRGTYDYGERGAPRISVDEVVLVYTRAEPVLDAYRLAKIILACQRYIMPNHLRLPETCVIGKIVAAPVDVEDVDSRRGFERFYDVVKMNISRGDVVDVSGGRVAMGVAAALAARNVEAMIVATTIPPERYQEVESAKKAILTTYDVKGILTELEQGMLSCYELVQKYPELAKQLAKLVTGQARTYVLYP